MAALLGLTSGTISVRIERLVGAGLVQQVAGHDARQRPVQLTDAGRDAWGKATLARTRLEAGLINDALTTEEVTQLDSLLAKLLGRLEADYGPAPRHDMTRGRRPST